MYVELYPDKVKALREERGMSPADLAVAAGLTARTARRAAGGQLVRAKTARAVAAALGVNPPQRLGRPSYRP